MSDYMSCQFCGEEDFDLMGLAHHVRIQCEKVTELCDSLRAERRSRYEKIHVQQAIDCNCELCVAARASNQMHP